MYLSTGYLAHPDMKRFFINDSTLFSPPSPHAHCTTAGIGAGVQLLLKFQLSAISSPAISV